MISPWARTAACVAALAALACDNQPTASGGVPSVFHIRAYVDADGSATFTAGDDAIADVTITLTSTASDATGVDATTDAEGLATFESVAPGGYVATLSGATPAGAVLATAASLGAVAPFEGDTLDTEFRFAYMPGVVNGIVFRDDDDDGVFTAGADQPGAGMTVSLFAGADADTTAEPLDETVTAADGTYSFARVRKGAYTLRITPPFVTMDIVGGRVRNIDVSPDVATGVDVLFSGTAILSITDAKGAAGQILTIEGVVTVAQGTFRTQGDNIYMRDASSGIQVFNLTPALGLVVGDSIRVTGLMGAFGGEAQIVQVNATTPPTVVDLGTSTAPAPRNITAAQLVARTFEGELVRVADAVLTAVPGGTSAAYNLTFQDEANPATTYLVRIEAGVGASVTRAFWQAGATYTLTGVLGSFNGAAQLKPRAPSDVALGAAAPLTIAQARARADDEEVTIAGIVTAAQGTYRNDNAYIQDPTGGIQIFNLPTTLGLALGDSIRVTGLMDTFSGEREVVRFNATTPPTVVVRSTGRPVPAPRVVTVAELNGLTFEGQLARIQGTVTVVGGGTGASYSVTFQQSGTNYTVRIDTPVGATVLRASFTVGQLYTVTGIISNFNGTAQVKPRNAADITQP